MKENEACNNCRFWHPAWRFKKGMLADNVRTPVEIPQQGIKRRAERGLCRRYAPHASALTTVWMETKSVDWCGDYDRMRDDDV